MSSVSGIESKSLTVDTRTESNNTASATNQTVQQLGQASISGLQKQQQTDASPKMQKPPSYNPEHRLNLPSLHPNTKQRADSSDSIGSGASFSSSLYNSLALQAELNSKMHRAPSAFEGGYSLSSPSPTEPQAVAIDARSN